MQRRNRSRSRAVLSSPFTLILAVVLLVFVARASAGMNDRAKDSADRLREVEASLARIEDKKEALTKKIADISTEEGVEASMREKYHAVEPGESVAVIVSNEAAVIRFSTTTAAKAGPKGFWKSVLGIFGIK